MKQQTAGPAIKCRGDFATMILVMLMLLGYRRSTYSMAMEADGGAGCDSCTSTS